MRLPKTLVMNNIHVIKTTSKNLLCALVLLSLGATASRAQEVNQSVGQSINGVDARVHADVTGQAPDQAGSRSRSPATSSAWAPTRTTTPSGQPAIPANSRSSQPAVPPVWSSPANKTADTSAKSERKTTASGTSGANEPSSRFTPTFGHLGDTHSTIGAGLRSAGHSTQRASNTRKHLSRPSPSHRKTRAKLQMSRGTRRGGS